MAYRGQSFPNARTRRVVVVVSKVEYEVLKARAEAQAQGNVSLYIREQLGFAEQEAQAKEHA
jgi:hypothetical protein